MIPEFPVATARSARASPFRSAAAMENPPTAMPYCVGGPRAPSPSPSRTETLLVMSPLVAATSSAPSTSRSASATDVGPVPAPSA
jgi:hypothetical protein